jgi:transcriptional regulator with PAS, ATPase and Fis domain
LSAIQKAYAHHQMKNSIELFTAMKELEIPSVFENFYTNDINIIKIMNYAIRLADMKCNIFIYGETGTGKELFAQAIHNYSTRKNKNFVPVNITALPQGLFESNLFGHKKGSFTGALKDQPGLCSKADGGTLFLDEIGDLDITCQSKLLRLIEKKEYYPVGSDCIEHSDFRLITATNKDLFKSVQSGKFRNDLYYRIKSAFIYLPPLKDRGNDIIYISKILLDNLSQKNNIKKKFSPQAIYKLLNYNYPGNFRELQHIIEYSFYKNDNTIIKDSDIEFEGQQKIVTLKKSDLTVYEAKKLHIIKVLKMFKTKTDAARALGISRVHLYKYIKKYKIDL